MKTKRNVQDLPHRPCGIYNDQQVERRKKAFKVWTVHQNKTQKTSLYHPTWGDLLIININNTSQHYGAHASVFVCPLIFTMI